MGKSDLKSVSLGTFFGFISHFMQLFSMPQQKTLFQKGASSLASIAFLLASTNL